MQTALYQLDTLVWELTLRCCFSCAHCGSSAGRGSDDELTREEALDAARQIVLLKCRRVVLIGGEIFLCEYWEEVARTLTSAGVDVSVITNGYLLDDKTIDALAVAGVRHVSFSVDGTREVHDAIRVAGSYDRCMEGIARLKARGFFVSVITTVSRRNTGTLEALYAALRETGIDAWQIQACIPMGNADRESALTMEEYAGVVRFVKRHVFQPGLRMGIADTIGYYMTGDGYLRGNPSGRGFYGGCGAGLRSAAIDSHGNVRGCEAMRADCFIEDNLRHRSLVGIWNDPGAFRYNRSFDVKDLSGQCASCPHAGVCKGGCRAMNYHTCGDMLHTVNCLRNYRGGVEI